MNNPTAPELNENNATRFIANPNNNKHAVLVWAAADYKLEWGDMNMDGPHMLINNEYGCALKEFFTTHKPVNGREHFYYKDAQVLALQVNEDTDIVTMVDGKEEARSTIQAGGWIIRNPGGEQYYNTDETFRKLYVQS